MILFLSADGDDAGLLAELQRLGPEWVGRVERPGWIAVDRPPEQPAPPVLAFARQTLPGAERVAATSVSGWARVLAERIVAQIPEGQPWRLHVWPQYGERKVERMGARAWHTARRQGSQGPRVEPAERPEVMAHAGENRCRLIVQAVREALKERRRHVLKGLMESTESWRPEDGLVQVVLTGPEQGWLSVVPAPGAFRWRQSLWPWRAGEISGAVDKTAPSRAFAKLVEAEARLGRQIAAGETCVDLGAAPGGWTYVAAQRGARVVAVDRSPLRGDLLEHPRVRFQPGDAFTYRPERPVDWLICDVIAAPERTAELLLDWLRRGDLRWFVVTLKLKGPADHAKVERLKQELPKWADPWFLTHLCANKGEVCAFGRRREESVPSR